MVVHKHLKVRYHVSGTFNNDFNTVACQIEQPLPTALCITAGDTVIKL